MYRILFLFILSVSLVACNDREEESVITEPAGTKYVVSESGIFDSYNSLVSTLNENQNMTIIEEVDFAVNARSVDRNVPPSRIIFFGNPNMGTTILQRNQLAALDLPQRILVFEQDGETYTMYNSQEYLESRYQLQGLPELDEISQAVENLITNTTSAELREAGEQNVAAGEGIITIESKEDFKRTYQTLELALLENNGWRLLAEIDHSENASKVGMQLRPTRLFLLSNPYLESAILEDNPTAALDFPQKMLVWEDENGIVKISYNDPDYLEQRYSIAGNDIELGETASVFNDIATYAAAEIGEYDQPEDRTIQFDTKTIPDNN